MRDSDCIAMAPGKRLDHESRVWDEVEDMSDVRKWKKKVRNPGADEEE
jgi:hypothetical protein